MTYSNYNDFAAALFTRAESVKQEKGWRYGQALFNCLHEERPDIANELRMSSANPFYRNAVDLETYETIRSLYEIKDDQ